MKNDTNFNFSKKCHYDKFFEILLILRKEFSHFVAQSKWPKVEKERF